MARFSIISKNGTEIRYEGKPRYIGTYLRPSYLEFSEISSPTPINWEVGDFVDYPRTGMRYRLYSVPQASKNAKRGSRGNSFTYSNVQLHSATKELEIALFRDLVDSDNNVHFSTSPDVATFENVEGIIRRIQACMDDLYPGKWEIRLASFDTEADAEVIEKISEAKNFALSGGTCLDALSKIYDLWDGIGWFHSYENGKEVITIGYANTRNEGNTTESYLYGKGNGLTAIKKNQTNKDEFATRLYVYGSERNLPARYYNGLDILNSESVDIRNLMLPLREWGTTDGKPDAHKAYLENVEAVAKYGVIPKVHYFDSADAGADIYPSIETVTIGEIRATLANIGKTKYSPSVSVYPNDNEAIDEIRTAINPQDNGVLVEGGNQYKVALAETIEPSSEYPHVPSIVNQEFALVSNLLYYQTIIPATFDKGEVIVDPTVEWIVPDADFKSVSAVLSVRDAEDVNESYVNAKFTYEATKSADGKNWSIKPTKLNLTYDAHYGEGFPLFMYVTITAIRKTNKDKYILINFLRGELFLGANPILDKTFHITLKQLGFDINLQAAMQEGKTISMKNGACEGRNFTIDSCYYSSEGDFWTLDLKRQKDKTLGMLFPNSVYPISSGDKFVLVGMAMPEVYVHANSEKLLVEGRKLLERASKIQNHYEPSIDAKVMVESGRTLREGMFMQITDEDVVDNTTDHIIIDTLSIYEDESAIPTYKVTLRERRKVTYKGTPSATSSTDTASVEEEETTSVVNLSGYYDKDHIDSMWRLEDGNLVTDKQVIINNNAIIYGDVASRGDGSYTPGEGTVTGVRVGEDVYTDVDNGILDMTEAFEGYQAEITLDTEMSDTSENAVQNKVIKEYVDLHPQYEIIGEAEAPEYSIGIDEEQLQKYLDDHEYVTEKDIAELIPDINLDNYATKAELKAAEETIPDISEYQPWWDGLKPLIRAEDGNVRIKTNVIVDGDTSSSGSGTDVQVGINEEQLQQYLDDNKYVTEDDLGDLDSYAKKTDVDKSIADLINGAPTTLDTLGEIATAFAASQDIIQALDQAIGQKANQSALDSLNTLVSSLQTTLNSINAWYSKLANLIVEDNGDVRINTNLIVKGDTASE